MAEVVVRAAGRVLPWWRAVLVVMEHFWIWYRRGWRATAVSSIVAPLLFLLAFGVGFGSLVDAGGRAAQVIGTVPYLEAYAKPSANKINDLEISSSEDRTKITSGSFA